MTNDSAPSSIQAIRSHRPKLAKALIRRARNPLVSGLFAAHMYNRSSDGRASKTKFMPGLLSMESEQYSSSIIQYACMDLDGSRALFEEYLFWTEEEELGDAYLQYVYKAVHRVDNHLFRSGLQLMHFDSNTAITVIDVALRTQAKHFMSEPAVKSHLRKVWERPGSNGMFIDSVMPFSPRFKALVATLSHVALWLCYASFLWSIPPVGQPMGVTFLEMLVWGWGVGLAFNELSTYMYDFASFSSYCAGSGNTTDLAVVGTFFAAATCRIISGTMDSDYDAQHSAQGWVFPRTAHTCTPSICIVLVYFTGCRYLGAWDTWDSWDCAHLRPIPYTTSDRFSHNHGARPGVPPGSCRSSCTLSPASTACCSRSAGFRCFKSTSRSESCSSSHSGQKRLK